MTYSNYKKSNIPWIGDIPKHWIKQRIKDCLTFKIGGTPPTKNEEYFDGENIWVSIADISKNDGDCIYDSSIKINDEAVRHSNVKLIKKGSLLYSFKLSVGLTTFAGCDLYTNEAIASFEPNNKVDLNYLKYIFQASFENNAAINIYGAKLFNSDLIKFAKFVMPKSIEEQKQIANYLDKKTAKIDATIAKNEELIQLLEEKRVALINQVVTKGLNPDVPMKDSGVEWIGEIPEHWDIRKFGHLINLITKGATPTSYGFDFQDEGINFIKVESIAKNGEFIPTKFNYISEECNNFLSRSKMKEGDLLFSIAGALGRVAIVNSSILPANTNQALAIIRINTNKLLTEYIFYALKADYSVHQIEDNTVQSAQANLSMESIKEFKILIPPINEQYTLIDYLNQKTLKIDSIINKIKKNITLLDEYKTSLIHHVVTGKIDVRGEEI